MNAIDATHSSTQRLFGRDLTPSEEDRLSELAATWLEDETCSSATSESALLPLARAVDTRDVARRTSRTALVLLLSIFLLLLAWSASFGSGSDLPAVLLEALVAGSAVLALHLLLGRSSGIHRERLDRILSMGRQGAHEWLDEYETWLSGAAFRSHWQRGLAAFFAMIFVLAISLEGSAGLSGTGEFVLGLTGLVSAYLCAVFAMRCRVDGGQRLFASPP